MRWILAFVLACLATVPGVAGAFTVSGRFLYEDRRWDWNGYTGEVQELPIRRAAVEVVHLATQQVLASGSTDASGHFAIDVTGQTLPVSFTVRCLTDGRPAGYEIRVVDNFQRIPTVGLNLAASVIYAAASDPVLLHNPATPYDAGDLLVVDPDGTGVAQAFNIFDNAVDMFDWMAQPGLLGRLPNASEFVVFGWAAVSPNGGSNYSQQGIYIGSTPNEDTDGWSDTVILHEQGHWYDDVFSRSDNPGGPHFLGDNDADVRLAYGEGAATFHCAKVREFRSGRLNVGGLPVDEDVSIYGDLLLPPAVGTAGGLSFAYDFETGHLSDGTATGFDLGQRGTANETNVTSALWDLMDGAATPDATPGADDDAVEVEDARSWDIERHWLPSLEAANTVTVEDWYQGWFTRHGSNFLKPEVDAVFVEQWGMPFAADAAEFDNALPNAGPLSAVAYTASGAHVVISELDLGAQDAVEIQNPTAAPVDLTGWQIEVYVNGTTNDPTRVFTFPAFTLAPGEVVAVHEGGDPLANGRYHLYGGSTPAQNVFNISWGNGLDGACVLRNAASAAVDFVKWRATDGTANTTPVPSGTAFAGLLDSPAFGANLRRDIHGSDTDVAANFTAGSPMLGAVNHPAAVRRTLYPIADQDVFAVTVAAGQRYGFEARGPFSATDPRLELLNGSGEVIGSNADMDVEIRDARLDFYAGVGGTLYLRVTHTGAYTDFGEYELLAFVRPGQDAAVAPASVTADAENVDDLSDEVTVAFLAASAYDSIAVYRDGTRLATLAGSATQYVDHVARGLYRWEVSGIVDGVESGRAGDWEFAGDVTCHSADDFESGNADLWITDNSNWDVTPTHASQGLFSFTDSPAGLYSGCGGVLESCFLDLTAEFGVPTDLPPGSTLSFDHICITEAGFDYGIVELSGDDGRSWVELARYDQSAYPEWADNVADPGDWKSASFDLSPYAYHRALLRFRLRSDPNIELDGWYVDNLRINMPGCLDISVGVGPATAAALRLLPPAPQPMRSSARLTFVLPVREERVDLAVFDIVGRAVRIDRLGPRDAGTHTWTWDGRDAEGRSLPSGAYFVRLAAGREARTQKLLKLAER